MRRKSWIWISLVAISAMGWMGWMGCAPALIKGTKVEATPKNKDVVSVVEQYRYHFFSKQWEKLLQLVSPRFHETRGTSTSNDDYGYETLRKKLLSEEMRSVRIVRFLVHVDKITYPTPTEAHVYIRKSYTFLFPRGKYQPGLNTGTLRQKMILEFDQGRWLFRRW